MNFKTFALGTALCIAVLGSGIASAGQELAQQKGCLACHKVDMKIVGPSFKDIAAKYNGDDSAPAMLSIKIREGGSGNWGQVPMPANPAVTEDEANALAEWVLAQ